MQQHEDEEESKYDEEDQDEDFLDVEGEDDDELFDGNQDQYDNKI